MSATIAPDVRSEPRPARPDEILHLLCHCQLNEDWQPTTTPMVAYCGWEDDDRADWRRRFDQSQLCAMCIDAERCPRCGQPKPAS